MLTPEEIENIAQEYVSHLPFISTKDDNLEIIDNQTIDKPSFSIFFYTSKKYLQTGDDQFAVGGNAPLFISKQNGKISIFRTGMDLEEMIKDYEAENL